MREVELRAYALDRLIESEAGLDADDEQIEPVGEPEPDAMLARLRRGAGDLVQAALDRQRVPRRQRHRAGRDEQRCEDEREDRKQEGHGYTSILMTWRIQRNPIVCMTIAPTSIVCPRRS